MVVDRAGKQVSVGREVLFEAHNFEPGRYFIKSVNSDKSVNLALDPDGELCILGARSEHILTTK